MTIINKEILPYKAARGLLALAGGIGTAAIVGTAISYFTPLDVKPYKKVAIKITAVAFVWAASDFGSKVVKAQFDGLADAINELGNTAETVKERVEVKTDRGEV